MADSGDRRHHCPSCGIRTHSSFVGTELKNDNVHYGTCIMCNPESVPASVRRTWKAKNPGATKPPPKQQGSARAASPGAAKKQGSARAAAAGGGPKPAASQRAGSPGPGPKKASQRSASPVNPEKKDVWARPVPVKKASARAGSPGPNKKARSASPASDRGQPPKQGSARAAAAGGGGPKPAAGPGPKKASQRSASPVNQEKKDVWARPVPVKKASARAGSPGPNKNGAGQPANKGGPGPKTASQRSASPSQAGSKRTVTKAASARTAGAAGTAAAVYGGKMGGAASSRDVGGSTSPSSRGMGDKQMSERRHHCPNCGIRTHMGAVGLELKNDDVHYGTCIKCNLKDVPPSIAKAWKDKNAGIVPDVEDEEKERMHHCDKCGIRTHRTLGFEIKNEEVHYGICVKCYPNDVPPSVLKAWKETQEDNSRMHHCESCGIRTHSTILGTELKNDDVHYGTCIKCNMKDVPPPVRQAYKKKQAEKEKLAKAAGSPTKDPNAPRPRLADQIIEKERRERCEKEGICPTCGVKTHNVTRFNREARKNTDVYYGVCIKCNPDDVNITPSARKAYEEAHKDDAADAVVAAAVVSAAPKAEAASPPPKAPETPTTVSPAEAAAVGAATGAATGAAMASVVSPSTEGSPSSSRRLADEIMEKERREALEKDGLCPDCGVVRTHNVSRFNREPRKNLDVYYGVCIACHSEDESIPAVVRKAWEDKQEGDKGDTSPVKSRRNMAGGRLASVPVFDEVPTRKGLDPVLKPKVLTPVTLGWNKGEQHVFDHVIAFCSHAKRTKAEKEEDKKKFGGIDRRVFSNLFVDDEPLEVAPNKEVMRHAALFTEGLCAESFYMAAKCEHEWDARFIMTDLKKSSQVEKYGHNRLELSTEQKNRLIEYGADPDDFKMVDKDGSKWLRLKSGKMPTREDWYDMRHNVVLHILNNKFGGKVTGKKTTKTVKALIGLIMDKGELPIFTEHRSKDAFWGDAKFGSGYSVLGKTITQVFLEITDKAKDAPFLSKTEAVDQLFKPNSDLVDYDWPSEDTAESSDSE